MVECLTRDREVAGSSLAGGTALCPRARYFTLCITSAIEIYLIIIFLKTDSVLGNSADPGEMPYNVSSLFAKVPVYVFSVYKGLTQARQIHDFISSNVAGFKNVPT